ncbi:MAG: ABC transporter ATP-binding protein [Burkholderiales bacterium]|jgi:ABC-type lipoprotein export system ATPase subunit|nr:ABC transporter ATP-binding protein [Burkholderiales bacterium]
MNRFIEAHDLTKTYSRGAEQITALNNVSFAVDKGDIVSVVGASGSGKTTLVNVLGCLDNPSSGTLMINHKVIFGEGKLLSEPALTKIRRATFGYVFQKFFLIPTLSVKENILLPSVFQPDHTPDDESLYQLMDMLGIARRENHLPSQLSGGEMQRVAIARALIHKPEVLIADEPTGNLDSKRSNEIKDLLLRLNQENGITVIIVTHNPDIAKIGNKTLELVDGKLMG